MNEKYIQALIVGGLIGAAIIIAEFISQSNDDPMKFHAIKLHEDSQVKMADKKIWITDNGETKKTLKLLSCPLKAAKPITKKRNFFQEIK